MEMDQEDGTEFVLTFAVDVNENRTESCKSHTLQPLAQTQSVNNVFNPGPKCPVDSRGTWVTSEEPQINGFSEPDGVIELSLEPKGGECKADTSGHIRAPDGETGCFGEISPNLTQNRHCDGSDGHLTVNGKVVDLWGFHGSPVMSDGTTVIGGTNGNLITSVETSETERGTHSRWLTFGETYGNDDSLTESRHTVTSHGTHADVWEFHARAFGNKNTSAETSGGIGTNINWAITRDVAGFSETNGSLTESRPVNTLDAVDPIVIGETVSTGESSGYQITSGEITDWINVHSVALVETVGTKGLNAVLAKKTVSDEGSDGILTMAGACASMAAFEETTTIWTNRHHTVTGETNGDFTANEESDGPQCTKIRHVTADKASQTYETNASPSVADKMVDSKETSTSLATSGECAASRTTNSNSVDREETARACYNNTCLTVTGETMSIGGNHDNLTRSGETAVTGKTNPSLLVTGIGVSVTTCRNVDTVDVKTAAVVTGEPMSMKETGVSQVLSRDQVPGNPKLGNDATKAKFDIWGNPDCQVHPWVCVSKHPSSFCTESEMKIPNGFMTCPEIQMDTSQHEGTFRAEALDKGVRVGNCGYLVINPRSISGTSSIPVYSIREPWNSGEWGQEVRNSLDHGPETISDLSKLCIANVNEEMIKQEIETRQEHEVDVSDSVGVARPRTLRTNPGQAVSLSCDSTPLNDSNVGYFVDDEDMDVIMNSLELGRRQSAPDKLQESKCADPEPSAEQTENKRQGFADFLTRSLFSWKLKDPKATTAAPGWRLFGKISPKGSNTRDSRLPPQHVPVRRKNLEFEPLSTTGLILEDRPANLPAKSEEEAERHRQQYSEMMAGVKRRELKEAQRKKKQMKERYRQEESIARALVVWNTEILPNWENMRNTRRVRELWWQGLPPSIRGKIWSLAIGNELNITPELYEIFLSRAKEKWRSFNETGSLSENEDCGVDKESSLDLIKLDIFRTFPSLYIFQKGGPYHDVLHNVLGAYTCYRPDVGYVQGMSFIAAVLILNLEEADAFIAFANLLNKPCQMAFFRVDHDLMLKYFAVFEVFFEENLPKLFQHFHSNSLTPDFYLIDWIFTLYSKPLPLDVACRVWDLFCRDGEEALFRTALGILRLYQDVLLQMDFIHSAQFLSRLPQNTPAHTLFTCISNTHMLSNNRRWNQVFSALVKDGPKEADKTGSPALRS
ncbi:uncharacterized protein tbc1d12a [Clarias gariepinus]|uniref:uncharacterized protein tbc1d12a n=1 Tax=Clarias gariepinus TaxID=13013 RepID=UPI00234D19B2|nr:uncharacterized protein tbc1d12a [Clarias gariepinus]